MENKIKEIINVLFSDYTFNKIIDSLDCNQEIISHNNKLFDSRLFMPNENKINFEYLVSSPFGHAFEVVAQYTYDSKEMYLTQRFYDYLIQHKNLFEVSESIEIKSFGVLESHMISACSIESLPIIRDTKDSKRDVFGNNLEYYLVEEGELNIFITNKYEMMHPLFGIYKSFSQNPIAVGINKNGRLGISPTINYKNLYDELNNLGLLTIGKFI